MYFATSLALLAAALPQGTGEPQHVRHAAVVPPDALAVVSTGPFDEHRRLMTTTGLDRILVEPDGIVSRLRRAALLRVAGSDAAELAELEDLGSLGITLALMPRGSTDRPVDALAVVDLSEADATALRTALNRRTTETDGILRQELAGTSVFVLHNVPGTPAMAVVGQVLLLGTSTELLGAAIPRARGRGADSLALSPRYATLQTQLTAAGGENGWLSLYVDVEGIWKWGLSQAPRHDRDEAAKWIDLIGLGAIKGFAVTIGENEGRIVERAVVAAPAPLPPLLAALFPATPVRTDDLGRLVSSDANAFGVAQVQWHDVFKAVMGIMQRGEPEAAAQANGMLQMIGQQLGGIDIEQDVLATLGARMVSMSWPAAAGSAPDSLVLMDLAEPDRLKSTLSRMRILEKSPLGNYDMFVPQGAESGVIAVGEGRLVFTSSERRLRLWMGDRRSGDSNSLVTQALRDLANDATGLGVIDVSGAASSALAGFDAAGDMLPEGADIARRIATDLAVGTGPVHYSTYADENGFTFVARSASGSVTRLCAAVAAAATERLEQDPMLASMLDQAQTADRSQDARKLVVLDAVRSAQERHRAAHGTFANLDTLVDSGQLRKDQFDAQTSPGVLAVGDSLVTVLLGPGGTRFAAVVWPKDRRPGEVLACADDRGPQRNELLARVSGLAAPEPRDLFVGGAFGGEWTPGWRAVGPVSAQSVARARQSHGGSNATFQVLTALEQQGEAGARELVGYLGHEDPLIVARAAWSLGQLKYGPAVPKLIELLEQHEDANIRQQAMGALAAMADPRTAQASARALGDVDATVRTLAASNLGKLKYDGGKDALVGVLAAPAEPVEDDADAVCALLALADLRDSQQLLPAATAFERESRRAQEALAWLFQELSPALGPTDEPMVLMAVLDHDAPLLRRYAIQRLGELADPKTASALEARLATESDELRPLVEVSLAAVRGASPDGDAAIGTPLQQRAQELLARAKAIWNDSAKRNVALAAGGGVFLLLALLTIAARRRRRRREGDAWAEMTRPSEGFEEHGELEYGEYDEAAEYDDLEPDGEAEYAADEQEAGDWDETYEDQEAEWEHDGAPRT